MKTPKSRETRGLRHAACHYMFVSGGGGCLDALMYVQKVFCNTLMYGLDSSDIRQIGGSV